MPRPCLPRARHANITRAPTLALILALILALCAMAAGPARAARLRPFVLISGAQVFLSDLFAGIDPASDHALGPAPAPGARYIVPAAQLAAIARQDGVPWQPQGAGDECVVARDGVMLARGAVLPALHAALIPAGLAAGDEIILDDFDVPVLPRDGRSAIAVDLRSFDAASGSFSADLQVAAPGMAPLARPLHGRVEHMVMAEVLTQRLPAGHVLQPDDLQPLALRAALLAGRRAALRGEVLGQALVHAMAQGAALAAGDTARPVLVARGGAVRMQLQAGGIAITATAVALQEGGQGEVVRVMNPASHAVLLAEVTGAGAVRVQPQDAPALLAANSGLAQDAAQVLP